MCLANDIRAPEAIDKLRPVKGADGIVGPPPMNPPTVRQISVPTTLSAGDFSALAGVTDERTKVKELLRHQRIMPSAVVLDPAITLHTPEWLWLSTGIRAVDHCVEGVCSNEAHVFGDAQALKGLALLASGLPRVKAQPEDLAARLDCQLGAWLSMGPLSSGVPMGAIMASAMSWALNSACRMGYFLHHAPGGHALEQAGKSGPSSADLGRYVAGWQRRRGRARQPDTRARNAAEPRRREDRA